VTEKKQWSDVSRAMDMGTTHGELAAEHAPSSPLACSTLASLRAACTRSVKLLRRRDTLVWAQTCLWTCLWVWVSVSVSVSAWAWAWAWVWAWVWVWVCGCRRVRAADAVYEDSVTVRGVEG
jgi:hypothetical protein